MNKKTPFEPVSLPVQGQSISLRGPCSVSGPNISQKPCDCLRVLIINSKYDQNIFQVQGFLLGYLPLLEAKTRLFRRIRCPKAWTLPKMDVAAREPILLRAR
jgi:hypothetical protein